MVRKQEKVKLEEKNQREERWLREAGKPPTNISSGCYVAVVTPGQVA